MIKADGLSQNDNALLKRRLSALVVKYQWDFGDGPGIGIKDPRHTYFNNSFNDTTWFVRLVGISEYKTIIEFV